MHSIFFDPGSLDRQTVMTSFPVVFLLARKYDCGANRGSRATLVGVEDLSRPKMDIINWSEKASSVEAFETTKTVGCERARHGCQ